MITSLEDLKTLFGAKLKKIRTSRGYTQKALSDLIDMDPNTLARIERGEHGIGWTNFEKTIAVLKVPACMLFETDDRPEVSPKEALEILAKAIEKPTLSAVPAPAFFPDLSADEVQIVLGFIDRMRKRAQKVSSPLKGKISRKD